MPSDLAEQKNTIAITRPYPSDRFRLLGVDGFSQTGRAIVRWGTRWRFRVMRWIGERIQIVEDLVEAADFEISQR